MVLVMSAGVMAFSRGRDGVFGGTPSAVKVACSVWTGGKGGDDFKVLPIGIVDSSNPPTAD